MKLNIYFIGLYELRGTAEEVSQINAHLKSQKDQTDETKIVPLDRPEQFLKKISDIPQFDERVACIIFEDAFGEATESVDGKLKMFNDLISVFKTGVEIRNILGMILRIGNYLNGGNRTRLGKNSRYLLGEKSSQTVTACRR